MNERILNLSSQRRVAKTLRSNCEDVSKIRQLVIPCPGESRADKHTEIKPRPAGRFSLTQGLKKHKTLSNLLGSEAYPG